MKSILLHNRCTKTRVKLADGNILQCFTLFYDHPAMINEEAWTLMKTNGINVLCDTDTMHVLSGNECEWGFTPTGDTILTVKLTTQLENQEDQINHWNKLYEFAVGVKKEAAQFFDKKKIENLADELNSLDVSSVKTRDKLVESTSVDELMKDDSDSDASCQKPSNVLQETEKTLPNKLT